MLLEAHVTSIWKKQKLFVAVFLLGISAWFFADGMIGYPRSNVRYNAWAKFRDEGKLQDWPEYAKQQGAVLSCPKPGPDVLIERDGNRVCVEAVVATNGVPGRPDTVVEPNPDGSGKIPEEKLVLRYSNAIAEKYRPSSARSLSGYLSTSCW